MHADVLIIGAGPSGGAAGLRLVQAGLSVVCLEQGGWPDRLAYRGGDLDWELTSMKQWSWDPNVRGRPDDYALDGSDCEVNLASFNGVGGGTTLFNAVWPRFTPSNFRSRSDAGYGDDWPFGYDELLPYYERTDREVGVAGLGGNPAYPPGEDPPLPPLPVRAGGMRVARGLADLGWNWWPEYNAILSAPYDGRNVCVARGACDTGCGEGAKGSADLTYWRHIVALGGTLVTGARVTRIVLDDQGRAAGAEWYDKDGTGHLQTADVVLCGANGIGTPRLLLASATSRFPDGLANQSGLLGRNLMLHHHGFAFGTFEESLETWRGQRGGWIGSWQFYESDAAHGAPGTAKWVLGGGPAGPLAAAMGNGVWGAEHHAALQHSYGRTLNWWICVEDVAVASNRVELSTTTTDSAGLPIPVVHYRIPEQARTLGDWQVARGAEALTAAGAREVSTPALTGISGHFMGTARMGNDPARSVVDQYGMSHEIPNLGVLDGSLFVTSAGVNPTTTICAVASRVADYLVRHRATIPRPELARSFLVRRPSVGPTPEPTSYPPVSLSPEQSNRLAELADCLIPGTPEAPGAREAGIEDSLAAAALRARPDLGPALARALSLDGDAQAVLARLSEDDPEARSAVELVVAGGYYMSAEVWNRLGYPGQLARPAEPDRYPAYIDEGLLDHLAVT